MYYKFSPIIIILLIIVIIVVTFFGIRLVMNKGNILNDSSNVLESSDMVPVLNLSLNTNEENQEMVTITAEAITDDESGILSITLPDGSVTRSNSVSCNVTQNGNYTFKAKGNNGQTTSSTIEVNNIREASSNNPYIPTGFSHVGGDVNSGYIIQDAYENQFVWIPVEDGKLVRNTMLDTDYEESNSTASALVNSVAQNYGFYIGRYEACMCDADGQKIAGSIGNRVPWTNVSYVDASEAASKSASIFGYEGYKTAIMNSYAWDTAASWIDRNIENYSTSLSSGNYSGNIRKTGLTEADIKNNICDMAGNVSEWTTEIYKMKEENTSTNTNSKNKNKNQVNEQIVSETVTYRVIRGGSAKVSRTVSRHTGYKENSSDPYWGFRMILYK